MVRSKFQKNGAEHARALVLDKDAKPLRANTSSVMDSLRGPLIRIRATAPSPAGVARAAIVDLPGMTGELLLLFLGQYVADVDLNFFVDGLHDFIHHLWVFSQISFGCFATLADHLAIVGDP